MIDNLLENVDSIVNTESLVGDVITDLLKDEIKDMIKKKLNENPEIRDGIRNALRDLLEAKVMESVAMMKLLKYGGDLGINLLPSDIKRNITTDIEKLLQKSMENLLIDQ